jgi:transcriptional regulator with XRE-family HTH domain
MEHPSVTAARDQLNDLKGRWPEISQSSGVSYSWLQKFARGDITNPTIDTLQAVVTACSDASAVTIKVA